MVWKGYICGISERVTSILYQTTQCSKFLLKLSHLKVSSSIPIKLSLKAYKASQANQIIYFYSLSEKNLNFISLQTKTIVSIHICQGIIQKPQHNVSWSIPFNSPLYVAHTMPNKLLLYSTKCQLHSSYIILQNIAKQLHTAASSNTIALASFQQQNNHL